MSRQPTNIDSGVDKMSAVLSLVLQAQEFGARIMPRVAYSQQTGRVNVDIDSTDGPIPFREIAAWQLATGDAWQVYSFKFMSEGVWYLSRHVEVTVDDIAFTLWLREPAMDSERAAALR
jgi:hypothetical protein